MSVKRRATIQVDADVSKAVAGMKKTSLAVRQTEKDTARLGETLKKLERQAEMRSAPQGIGKLKAGLAGLAGPAKAAGVAIAAIGAAAVAISKVAHESLAAQAAVNNLTWSVAGAAEASMGLVDNATLATSQVRALQLGAVDSLQGFEDLTEAGSKLGLVMMGDASKGVEDLTTALSRGSPLMLDNLGITLTLGQAQEEYAAQLGKSVKELTAAEKAEAFKTVGLQKALKAAREKNIEEGFAVDILQAEVALLNEKTELLGAEESASLRVASAIESMGDEVIGLNVKAYGSDLKKLEKQMRLYGVSVEEAGGLTALHAEVTKASAEALRRQALAAEEAAAAQEKLAMKTQLANATQEARRETVLIERAIELSLAEGAITQKEATTARIAATASRIDAAKAALAEAEADGKATDAMREAIEAAEHSHRVQEAIAARGGRGSGRRKKRKSLDDLINEAVRGSSKGGQMEQLLGFWESEADAKLAMLEDVGALRQAQLDREAEAEAAAFDLRSGRLEREIEWRQENGLDSESQLQALASMTEARMIAEGDINGAEQVAHDERIRRMKIEQDERERVMKQITGATALTVQAFAASTEAAFNAKDSKGKAFAAELGDFTASRAKILGIESATHLALAAVWAAAGNPLKASMEATAGGIAAAKAGALGAAAAAFHAMAGSSGGSDLGGSVGGLGGGGAIPVVPSGTGSTQTPNTAPVSPLEQNGQPVPAANQAPGGSVQNFYIEGLMGGEQLEEIMAEAHANGRSFAGGAG